jgi:hypothetical protein
VIGADLMRDAALLGAACVVGAPADRVLRADDDWPVDEAIRSALTERLREHELSNDALRIRLCDGLGLDHVAYWLVMLCAAVEVHPEAAAAVSLIAEDPRLSVPTPAVVARLLRGTLDVPFADGLGLAIDGGAARRAGLVEVLEPIPGLPRTQHGLRLVGPELLALLAGGQAVGASRGLLVTTVPPARAPAYEPRRVERATALLTRRGMLILRAPSRRAGRQMACDLAAHLGLAALLVNVHDELPPILELTRLREGLPVLDLRGLGERPAPPAWLEAAKDAIAPLVVIVDGVATLGDSAALDVPPLRFPEAHRVWAGVVGHEDADDMAARFRVSLEEAHGALVEGRHLVEVERGRGEVDLATLAGRLRAQGARRMGPHVSVIEATSLLSDLVVPNELRRRLDEIVTWYQTAHRVRWEMGVLPQSPLGRGLTCLFSGRSGTGKTFAAQCLAAELTLNLYRIDLSRVVSKYIGETEKALAEVFDEVEAGHGLLLFDEADALFGRRSEVKDAHDRYANIEVGYLLQRLESFEGIAILTTNLQGNMDPAFVRRLRFVLQFPVPDAALRRRLWERSLPGPRWRSDELELDIFAERFQFNGGNIHNVGLAAAPMAAATPAGRVEAAHLVRATVRELQKTGRPSDAAALGPLARHLNGAKR